MSENKITKHGILELFKLDSKLKKVYNIDYIFQILSVKLNENQPGKGIYSCNLSDATHKYGGVVLINDNISLKIQPYDLIKIKQLTISTIKRENVQTETIIFLVKSFELIEHCSLKFGSPIELRNIHYKVPQIITIYRIIMP